ncbi:hypothetical protein LQZ19_00475 [Treponema primitia]|uniref:hypothetical protein n=1 Tax=Treponema primitia TaxID=88058 RepID=UPI00397F1D73
MVDSHVHIGQFENISYPAEAVFTAVAHEEDIESILFSSTTSCREDIRYTEIEQELKDALAAAETCAIRAEPLLWFVPDYIRQGVSVESAMGSFPYTGIKLHPRAHCWDLTDEKIIALVHELFAYVDTHTLSVLKHTGDDKVESPHKFSNFLAHIPMFDLFLHMAGL